VVLAASLAASTAAPAPAGQSTSPAVVDPQMSVAAGAALMGTLGEVVARSENAVVPHRLFAEQGIARRAANVSFRLGRFFFFDVPQEHMLMVVNHEVFGHGARLRERFDGPVGYRFEAPPPYGGGGGSTTSVFDREPSPHELLAIHAAGMEAGSVGADLLASRTLLRNGMTPRDAMRYLELELDTLAYVLSTDEDGEEPGHDVADFILVYNELASVANAATLQARTLKREALLGLANPMVVYAVWGIGRYLSTGATDVAAPMLTIGGVRYLPLLRYRLTSFGTEWSIVNELGGRLRPTQIELRIGRAPGTRPWGISVRQRELAAWRQWTLELALAFWRQPRLMESADDPVSVGLQQGLHVRGRVERPLIPMWFTTGAATVIVEIGAKSAGFVAGEPLGAGWTARAGIGLPLAR
jgi:hypothetical protein